MLRSILKQFISKRKFRISLEKGHFRSLEKKGRGLDPQDPPVVARLYNFHIGTVQMQLIRNTFCYGIEAALVQCKLGLKSVANKERLSPMTVKNL